MLNGDARSLSIRFAMVIPRENGVPQETMLADCARIAAGKEFRNLLVVKRMFIIPAFIFFLLNFFALSVLAGYAPNAASTRVIGTVNLVYLFALLQFVLGWVIAGLYLMASVKFDRLTKDILAQVAHSQNDPTTRISAPRGGR